MEFSEVIRTAIELGRRNGFVTFDQLNALIDGSRSEPEDVEDLMEALRDNGINLREG